MQFRGDLHGASDTIPKDLHAEALLERFNISTDDLNLLQTCGQALVVEAVRRVLDRFYDWLSPKPQFDTFPAIFVKRKILSR